SPRGICCETTAPPDQSQGGVLDRELPPATAWTIAVQTTSWVVAPPPDDSGNGIAKMSTTGVPPPGWLKFEANPTTFPLQPAETLGWLRYSASTDRDR